MKSTGHSARRGRVTTGRRRGRKPEELRKQCRYAAHDPVFRSHGEDGGTCEDAGIDNIGLWTRVCSASEVVLSRVGPSGWFVTIGTRHDGAAGQP
ncbi:hypothetical protein EHYA_08760 [Embleya hyalina]|uniref:Uncharacterized protein n=1 Tax=Embleya hyalina TaxID=516124 RepID=A0A401Z2J4_9ACTN|nr:hypothetical protein EHYA_08760 [Embleya hyalina]